MFRNGLKENDVLLSFFIRFERKRESIWEVEAETIKSCRRHLSRCGELVLVLSLTFKV